MKIKDFTIPPEARRISVTGEGNRLIIEFEPEHPDDVFCEETGHIERHPRIGNIAVLWKSGFPHMAIISILKDEDYKDDINKYLATNGEWYDHAVIFRNEDQYKTITNGKKKLPTQKED